MCENLNKKENRMVQIVLMCDHLKKKIKLEWYKK